MSIVPFPTRCHDCQSFIISLNAAFHYHLVFNVLIIPLYGYTHELPVATNKKKSPSREEEIVTYKILISFLALLLLWLQSCISVSLTLMDA